LKFPEHEIKPSQQPDDRADDDALAAGADRRSPTIKDDGPGKANDGDHEIEPVRNNAAAQIDPRQQGARKTEQGEKDGCDHEDLAPGRNEMQFGHTKNFAISCG